MLEKLVGAERSVLKAYATGRFDEGAKGVEDLVIGSLSQTYVRLVRSELWRDDPKERTRRLAIFATLGQGLRKADELLHPVAPFATEFLFQEVFAPDRWKAPCWLSAGARGPREGLRPRRRWLTLRFEWKRRATLPGPERS